MSGPGPGISIAKLEVRIYDPVTDGALGLKFDSVLTPAGAMALAQSLVMAVDVIGKKTEDKLEAFESIGAKVSEAGA